MSGDELENEHELLITRYAIAGASGYRMRDGRAWAPCALTDERGCLPGLAPPVPSTKENDR